jgi:hypothetical protein
MTRPRHEKNSGKTPENLFSQALGHATDNRHERALFRIPFSLKTTEHAPDFLFRLFSNAAGYKKKKSSLLLGRFGPSPRNQFRAETIRIVHVHLAPEDDQSKGFHDKHPPGGNNTTGSRENPEYLEEKYKGNTLLQTPESISQEAEGIPSASCGTRTEQGR